jgi:uncharacterized protein YfbU (UPF0304 family)
MTLALTLNERLALRNQYEILHRLEPGGGWDKKREIVERGWTMDYASLVEVLSDELSPEDCSKVVDILDLYSALQSALSALEDKTGIEPRHTLFPGFDGNDAHECRLMAYARFLERDGRFVHVKRRPGAENFNGHHRYLEQYDQMLEAWIPLGKIHELSREQIQSLIAAGEG